MNSSRCGHRAVRCSRRGENEVWILQRPRSSRHLASRSIWKAIASKLLTAILSLSKVSPTAKIGTRAQRTVEAKAMSGDSPRVLTRVPVQVVRLHLPRIYRESMCSRVIYAICSFLRTATILIRKMLGTHIRLRVVEIPARDSNIVVGRGRGSFETGA